MASKEGNRHFMGVCKRSKRYLIQSVTYQYREFPVPGIFNFFGGIGTGIGKIWYRKKVPEPVSEKFGTGKRSRNRYRKNLVPEQIFVAIWKIYNGYRYRNREFFIFSGGIGTGIGKIWYRKKVSEPVSVKFGTGKSLGTGIGKNLVPEKVPVSVSKIFGTGKK